jgi:hypothetical protein
MKKLILLLALTGLCGCFEVEDELVIDSQGSGNVTITVKAKIPEEMEGAGEMAGSELGAAYPPFTEAAARRLFPAKDFTVKTEKKDSGGTNVLTIHAAFKDVNAMLASPYAAAHQLYLQTNNGALVLRAVSGLAPAVQSAFSNDQEASGFMDTEVQSLKTNLNQMRFEFRVRMPSAISQANGDKNGSTVSWSGSRAQAKSDEEYIQKTATTMEASCPAQGLQFSPRSPFRLGLLNFQDLTELKSMTVDAVPESQKVIAAAKIIPYRLRVSRKLDLSGESAGHDSKTEFLMGVTLSEELQPQSWGQLKLDEVVDSSGKSLLPKEDEDSMFYASRVFSQFRMEDDADETGDTAEVKGPSPRLLSANFLAPEWNVKRINKIRGHVELSYKGATEIVKLANALPASRIITSRNGDFTFDSNEHNAVQHPKLQEFGVSLRIEMAMQYGGNLQITMNQEGDKASIQSVQVFDSDGKPVPTTMQGRDFGQSNGEERSISLMVSGKPKPPLSLALEIGAPGGVVSLPVQFENVPVSAK